MMSRAKALKYKPETNKAIVLASSAHQIFINGSYNRTLEGAGLISASWADDIANGIMGNWGEVLYDCTYPVPYQIATMPGLQSGLRTRVSIAWGQPNQYANYLLQPSANLVMEVRDPSGNLVSLFGNSHDDTYQWIEFVTAIPGDYTINVNRRYCDSIPNGVVGYAYWQLH